MVMLKMLMEIALPKMGELLVMLLPKFRLKTAVLRPESPLLFF